MPSPTGTYNMLRILRLFRTALVLLFLVILSLNVRSAVPGLEPKKSWQLDGYVKYMATYAMPKTQSNTLDHLIHNRMNFEYRFSDEWRVNVGMRNRALWGDALNLPGYAELVALDNGYFDLSKNWREGDVIFNTQLDRLNVTWNKDTWRVRAGRFRVNWSMNTIWNPNDIYNAYSIYDFDYEERAGTDAVSISKSLGFADGVDVIFAPAKDSGQDSTALRYLANQAGWDYQLLVGRSRLDYVIGAGFSTDLYEAGIRGEVSWFDPVNATYQGKSVMQTKSAIQNQSTPQTRSLPQTRSSPQTKSTKQTTVASLEMDYSFGGERNWLGRTAWLYISAPQDVNSALAYLNLPLDAKTLSFTRHTWYGDVSFDLTSLNRLTLSASYYDDHSYFLGASSTYSLANDWQLLTVIQAFGGSDDSLFGEDPTTLVFANIKYSF